MSLRALLDLELKNAEEIRNLFYEEGFDVEDLPDKEHLLDKVSRGNYELFVIKDPCSPSTSSALTKIKELDPRIEVICIRDRHDEELAIEAIKSGATACFDESVSIMILKDVIKKIKRVHDYRRETHLIESALNDKYVFANIVSRSSAMLDILSLINRIAPYYRTMLVTGDTGTGKELLAKAVHKLSPFSKEPFLAFNCSGFVETLIESELFGHVKGAFTGAVSDKKGLFEAAGSGTVFLDEIGTMPQSFQSHLLRVLQDGEFRRVGSAKPMKANCRVIAAAGTDLREKVKKGLFREDLYFRLAVVTIKLPPLKERKEDIPLLFRFFLNRLNKKIGKNVLGLSRPVQNLLMSYDWPGNIRELENLIERAILVTTANFIRVEDLPPYIKTLKPQVLTTLSLDDIEKNHIQRVLLTTGNNKTKAAAILGLSRRSLLRRIQKYGLDKM